MSHRILIVDDEFGLADVIAEMLREEGHDVAVTINGRLALASMERSLPAIVFMDVMMPVMDGPSALRAMRRDPRLAAVPVVMMTALPEALPKDDPPLFQAWLRKPFPPAEMHRLIDEFAKPPQAS